MAVPKRKTSPSRRGMRPLGRRAQGPDLRRRQGFGRAAPPASYRPQERNVSGPPAAEAEVDGRRSVTDQGAGARSAPEASAYSGAADYALRDARIALPTMNARASASAGIAGATSAAARISVDMSGAA